MADRVAVPDHVYVPSRRAQRGADEVELELRRLDDGRLAMLTFSDLDRLVAGCGTAQPWILVPTERLEQARREAAAEVVLLDVAVPTELRHAPEGRDGR